MRRSHIAALVGVLAQGCSGSDFPTLGKSGAGSSDSPVCGAGDSSGTTDCSKGDCLRWFNTDYIRDPDPFAFTRRFDQPSPALVNSTSVVALLGGGRTLDVSSSLSDAALTDFSSASMFLTAVESGRTLRVMATPGSPAAAGVRAVMLARAFDGHAPHYIFSLTGGVESFDPKGDVIGFGTGARAAAKTATSAASTSDVLPSDDVHAVYSAVEGTIYAFGGHTPEGDATPVIWQWSIANAKWTPVMTLTGPYVPASTILGQAYDSAHALLYVLDVDDDDQRGAARWARLVRYNLGHRTTRQLLRLPYAGRFRHTSLTTLEDGSLVLLVSSPGAYTAWRLDGTADAARFLGGLNGKGDVLDVPVMGEDSAYVAVSRGHRLEIDQFSERTFRSWPPCAGL